MVMSGDLQRGASYRESARHTPAAVPILWPAVPSHSECFVRQGVVQARRRRSGRGILGTYWTRTICPVEASRAAAGDGDWTQSGGGVEERGGGREVQGGCICGAGPDQVTAVDEGVRRDKHSRLAALFANGRPSHTLVFERETAEITGGGPRQAVLGPVAVRR